MQRICFQILESLPYTHYSWAWKNQSSGTHIGWREFLLNTQDSFLKSRLEIQTHCQNKESLPAKCKHREARRWSQEPQAFSHTREASPDLSYRNLPVYQTLKMQSLTSAPPWPKRRRKRQQAHKPSGDLEKGLFWGANINLGETSPGKHKTQAPQPGELPSQLKTSSRSCLKPSPQGWKGQLSLNRLSEKAQPVSNLGNSSRAALTANVSYLVI